MRSSTPEAVSARMEARRSSGFQSRMAVRLMIAQFLGEPQKRVKIVTLWRHEAQLLPVVQQAGGLLASRHSDKWYKRIFAAFESTLSNLLDANDSPVREVVIDFVSREAKRSTWRAPRDDSSARPPQIEGMRQVVLCFTDAVQKVRTSQGYDSFTKSQ